ncbi:MAG: aldo/keto reductase [Clostridia bacterium]|nr:aldo/keto reductase [Clostridia bacterium]
MQFTTLGRIGLRVSRTGFGAIPIQRIDFAAAKSLLLRAVDGGINFFDTARGYSDSEEKIGQAFQGLDRTRLVIATKTPSRTGDGLVMDLAVSLEKLGTDYIDIYQFHNPDFLPAPGGADGLYDAALDAKRRGLIRHIGITQHDANRAVEAAKSGWYDTVQFPLSYLSDARDLAVVDACRENGIGFIAMKGMSGGLLSNAAAAHAFMRGLDIVVPIWGIEKMSELEDFLRFEREGVVMNDALRADIERDRAELTGSFCRGCGYCLPCPVGIPINIASRLSYLMKRTVAEPYLAPDWQERMENITHCTECGQCESKCPYGLKPYELLKVQLELYRENFR